MNYLKPGMIGVLLAVTIGAGVYAVRERSAAQRAETIYAGVTEQQAKSTREIATLEDRLREQSTRADGLEAGNATLREELARAKNQGGGTMGKSPPLTREALEARLRAARESVRNGDPAEVLRELLWGLDEGVKQGNSATAPLWRGRLIDGLRELAQKYPPAQAELQLRRDALRKRILANVGGADFVSEYTGILRALKEEGAVLSLLDEIPAGDRRRATVAIYGSEELIQAKRYAEIMEGRSVGSMFSRLEADMAISPAVQARLAGRMNPLVMSVAKDIEVLAGSGDVASAKELVKRLLAVDSSEATKNLIQQHATRAGHPELLSAAQP